MRKKNVAYLRVSTEAQTEKYGLDMQKQKILDYCDKEGIIIDKWYIDGGYSGSKLDRPEIQELLHDAEEGQIAKVFIYKLDRVSRDVIDTLNLLYRLLPKYGVQIVSMTEDLRFENPMDKVMIGVNAIMGQYEREVIYMRTRAGMKERVKKGFWMGGGRVPLGYYYDRNDGILHPDKKQAEMVKEAYRLYIDGYSCEKIAKILGFSCESSVRRVLTKKANIGIIEYNGKEYKGKHDPIIDKETFYKVQECIKKRHTNSHLSNSYILSGLCFCGRCGARMRYMKWGRIHKLVCYSQGTYGRDYMAKDPNCDNEKANAEWVENEVEDCFKQFVINADEGKKQESKVEVIRSSINKTNSKIKKLYSLYAENDSDNLLEVIRDEEKKLKELEKELKSEIDRESADKAIDINKIKRVADVWDSLSNKEKNTALKECVEKVVIDGEDIEVHFKI